MTVSSLPRATAVASSEDDSSALPGVDSWRPTHSRTERAMRSHVEHQPRAHSACGVARDDRTRFAGRAAIALALSGLLVVGTGPGSATADPPEREHTVTTSPAEGRFRCGDLLLTTTAGTQTETIDGMLTNGVAHVRIQRRYDDVKLSGSDGRTYRAVAHVDAHFVLVAPDFDNPVRGDEVIHVTFLGGPQGSPGYLNEQLRIRDGVETDQVTGTCDYAD
jgi:hypothetical protein